MPGLELEDVEAFRNLDDDQLHRVISATLQDLVDADLPKLLRCVNLKALYISGSHSTRDYFLPVTRLTDLVVFFPGSSITNLSIDQHLVALEALYVVGMLSSNKTTVAIKPITLVDSQTVINSNHLTGSRTVSI